MIYWEVRSKDADGELFGFLAVRGTPEQFTAYLQGLGTRKEREGLWAYRVATHDIEVRRLSAEKYMMFKVTRNRAIQRNERAWEESTGSRADMQRLYRLEQDLKLLEILDMARDPAEQPEGRLLKFG